MHLSDVRHPNSSLQQKLEYLYGLRTGSKVNWDGAAYLELLASLGNPHLSLPPAIHVAGTNGKGSVVALLRAVMEAAGKSVHVYTSPHLIRVNERIVLGGTEITDAQLHGYIDLVLAQIKQDAQLSFFEIMTAIAFRAFADHPADIVLLEVGMGGRLDCTNVIERPLVSVINRISMDHVAFLGDDLAQIAAQKAGIIKNGVPCVVGYQGDDPHNAAIIHDVICAKACDSSAPVSFYGDGYDFKQDGQGFMLRINGQEIPFPFPALIGVHQVYNAALAVAALSYVVHDFGITQEYIVQGFAAAKWRGRLQQLPDLCEGTQLWLDCGHNDSAGEALALQAEIWARDAAALPLILVVGMLSMKDMAAFVRPILPFCARVICVPISGEPSSQDAQEARDLILSYAPETNVEIAANVKEVIKHAKTGNFGAARVLVAGSVYLAGEALRLYE